VASRLGRTVREAKASLTLTEFEDWVLFLEWEDHLTDKPEHLYLAQIAAVIFRGTTAKNPKSVKLENFQLKFMTKDQKDKIKKSKLAWGVPPELLKDN
jgi:hypothetical protein